MGQAKKRRPCPAVNRDITAVECGENRLSRYACPESCPYNPFRPTDYSAMLEIDDRLDAKVMKRFAGEGRGPDLLSEIEDAQRRDDGHGAHAAAVRRFFLEADAQGRTFGQRWCEAGFAGLTNDERVLLQAKMRMRVVLLEVHRIVDDLAFEAVDLLEDGGPELRFLDRSTAAQGVRFSTLLGWAYPTPHFWRMSGTAIDLAAMNAPFSAREMVDAWVAHLGGPGELSAKRRWLAENFSRMSEAITATANARRQQMFQELDACFGAATYDLGVSAEEIRSALAREGAINADELSDDERSKGFTRSFVWFELTDGRAESPAGRRVLGRILLGDREARVAALGAARLDDLKARFEALLGPGVRFSKERRDDLAARVSAGEPPVQSELVPPKLLERPMRLDLSTSRLPESPAGTSADEIGTNLKAGFRRQLPDEPMPALDGRTPREAAKDPLLRPRLIEVMKMHVRGLDEDNLQDGTSEDINSLIRELGLTEIDFRPPPPRAKPASDDADDEEDDVGDYDDADEDIEDFTSPEPEPFRPEAPPLQDEPWTNAEAYERVERAVRQFKRAADVHDELVASGATLIDDLAALTDDVLNDNDFNFLLTAAYQVWFAFVPPGVRAPEINYEAMEEEFDRICSELSVGGAAASTRFKALPEQCRQPELLDAVTARLLGTAVRLPKAQRPDGEAKGIMVVALKVLIDELDRTLRDEG